MNGLGRRAAVHVLLAAALLALPRPGPATEVLSVAVPPLEFVQTDDALAGGAPNGAERRRMARVQASISAWLERQARVRPLRHGAGVERLAQEAAATHLRVCHACAVELGREVGADAIAVGWAQKVSELILNLNVLLLDTRTGEPIAGRSVDMRGNTDVSWQRATERLLGPALGEAVDAWAAAALTRPRNPR